MYIFNLKLNKKMLSKIILLICFIICFILLSISIAKFITKVQNTSETTFISDSIPSPEIANITEENYTNILKQVHENLETYLNQKISFIGYVLIIQLYLLNQIIPFLS